jgi:hypothetical protein
MRRNALLRRVASVRFRNRNDNAPFPVWDNLTSREGSASGVLKISDFHDVRKFPTSSESSPLALAFSSQKTLTKKDATLGIS